MDRPNFFQSIVVLMAGAVTFPYLAKAEERRRGSAKSNAKPEMVSVSDAAAKAVNYVEKNTDIKDTKLQTDRAGIKFKDQKCYACAFYMKDKEATVNGKKAGGCQMPFAAGKLVTADGWCSSWAKK